MFVRKREKGGRYGRLDPHHDHKAREPEWTGSNANLLLYRILTPSQPCPTGRQWAGRGPSEKENW